MDRDDFSRSQTPMDTQVFEGLFRYDFWSVVLMDGFAVPDEYGNASNSRQETRQSIGLARGVASISTPQRWNSAAPLSAHLRETFVSDESTWDHVVEFDFDCRTGIIAFGELDSPNSASFPVPSGHYRARWSGRGYDKAYAEGAEDDISPDAYRLDLASRTEPGPIVEIRRWYGFDKHSYFKS